MFLNSARERLIRIEDLDQEIEGEEPFQSRIGSSNFGAKKAWFFCGVDPGYETLYFLLKRESKIESVISQRDKQSNTKRHLHWRSFFAKLYMPGEVQYLRIQSFVLTLDTLGDRTHIGSFLYVSSHPR
jgi:hypothetical protein